jgi:chloramphenicol 3-O-phosphotransferase
MSRASAMGPGRGLVMAGRSETPSDVIVDHASVLHERVHTRGAHEAISLSFSRERSRGDRRIGEGRSHAQADLIHTIGPYDFTIDITFASPGMLANSVLAAWRARGCRRAPWPRLTDL